ncbi:MULTISPECIES: NADH-quinone oxidoreductase subunit NuoN [Cytobacillus]|uniref:NADH-quinone oxidoreductase subunit N n=2 Tax=Cytobacillus TaxID=2675230 RepID=A0ABX3CSG9_9BACI|nr:NADH-quinone oxidoreductase subunit NuoN [Cytobacillus oceanisediminis]EFV78151.1 NADH dehydrogenase subunit N [Bacillus sp. 2_A_57_CT2]MCS0826626.1 NADH-quinone oxidoreductase subunit NuoN [Cytobacillus firmus]MBU8731922.1 NADH-quinone oxidoreductase subunit NuoN [Cytobacillus oceanisediminis]MCM3243973.1 NADH-quinone oxidoreductase subunit NuoN [Cytobacillus oceanisediminis]MCM3402208.1 NADH-quinone oxidoreductase subunit NuoN [Cytobacillus oceanisediminis]
MDLETLLSYEWGIMTPEFIILGVATALSLMDLFMPKSQSRKILGWVGFAGVLAALVSLLGLIGHGPESILLDTFRLDSFAKAFKLLLLIGSAMVLLIAIGYEPNEGLEEFRGEFFYLFMAALLGAMIMSSSGDLITLFVGLELLSISSYILAGMRKRNLHSNESAMKYVINGSIATAITLFGMSYVYGLTGTTNLKEMAGFLPSIYNEQHIYLLGLAFFMIVVGLSFKLAAAPFHMWAPDVYQGAPTPVTAFLSVVSKTAGFIIIIRILFSIFANAPSGEAQGLPMILALQDYIAFLAGATMIIGNLIALRQRNIKRLFAYSSIAQAGYLLVVIASMSLFMFDTLWFYLGAYLFMNLGAFAIIQHVTHKSGSEDISQFAGLYRRAPFLAIAMAIFLLSLAGIPGTAGFIGKLNIFMGALVPSEGHYVLVSIMIATTVVSYFYYFGVMVQMFFRPAGDTGKVKIPAALTAVIGISLAATILFGVAPNIAFDFLQGNFNQFTDFFQ